MKKLFLFFGMVGFYAATAQKKDLFDVEHYLKKKKASGIIPPDMRNPILAQKPISSQNLILKNGDIIKYGAGRMPVVIPGNQFVYTMPNAGRKDFLKDFLLQKPKIGLIPNGAIPYFYSIF